MALLKVAAILIWGRCHQCSSPPRIGQNHQSDILAFRDPVLTLIGKSNPSVLAARANDLEGGGAVTYIHRSLTSLDRQCAVIAGSADL